jgi:hypothetical protein
MKNIAKVWDATYQDSLYVDEVEGEGDWRGLQFTLTGCGHTIVIPPEQAKKLRLALARYEAESKKS